jgi:hypothetical protein
MILITRISQKPELSYPNAHPYMIQLPPFLADNSNHRMSSTSPRRDVGILASLPVAGWSWTWTLKPRINEKLPLTFKLTYMSYSIL